jgi:hypothetical protein
MRLLATTAELTCKAAVQNDNYAARDLLDGAAEVAFWYDFDFRAVPKTDTALESIIFCEVIQVGAVPRKANVGRVLFVQASRRLAQSA